MSDSKQTTQSNRQNNIVCQYFLRDACSKKNCSLSHSPEKFKCPFSQHYTCLSKCPFYHGKDKSYLSARISSYRCYHYEDCFDVSCTRLHGKKRKEFLSNNNMKVRLPCPFGRECMITIFEHSGNDGIRRTMTCPFYHGKFESEVMARQAELLQKDSFTE